MERGIFDTHVHYDDEAFSDDRKELLESLLENGITCVVNVGADLESSKKCCEIASEYPFVYAAVGVHPDEVKELDEDKIQQLKELTKTSKVVAIGEIGLDYYWEASKREVQKEWFIRQISLAKECDLPIIIHSREAAQDTMEILKAEVSGGMSGVIHCYSYSLQQAREYVDMGFFIGIGGIVTFKNAKKIKEVVAALPLETIVLETDSPYLSPTPNRGKRNSSLNLPYVAEEIAKIRGISSDEVITTTFENAKRLYRLER